MGIRFNNNHDCEFLVNVGKLNFPLRCACEARVMFAGESQSMLNKHASYRYRVKRRRENMAPKISIKKRRSGHCDPQLVCSSNQDGSIPASGFRHHRRVVSCWWSSWEYICIWHLQKQIQACPENRPGMHCFSLQLKKNHWVPGCSGWLLHQVLWQRHQAARELDAGSRRCRFLFVHP